MDGEQGAASNARKSNVLKWTGTYRHFGTLYLLFECHYDVVKGLGFTLQSLSLVQPPPPSPSLQRKNSFFFLRPLGLFFKSISKEEFCPH